VLGFLPNSRITPKKALAREIRARKAKIVTGIVTMLLMMIFFFVVVRKFGEALYH
jgi:hypothetical protein